MERVGSTVTCGDTTNTPDKIKHTDKSYKGFVKLKMRRYLTSEKSNLYEFKMALFDNGDTEELFFSQLQHDS